MKMNVVIIVLFTVLFFTSCGSLKTDIKRVNESNKELVMKNKELRISNGILLDRLDECESKKR